MTLLALGPTTLMAVLLLIYFTFIRLDDAEQHLRELGAVTALHIAASAEFGVVTGNKPLLQNLINGTIQEGQAQFALIVDAQMQHLAQAGKPPPHLETDGEMQALPFSQQDYVFAMPIHLSAVHLLDTQNMNEPMTRITHPEQPLGWAIVAMSRAPLQESKRQMLLAGMSIVLAGLGLTIFLALRIGRGVSRPIRKLSQVVEELAQGNLHARVEPSAGGELLLLQKGFNSMAHSLETHQAELEQKIRAATTDLEAKKSEAEQSNRAKSNFLASASHDLRQPMHAIGLFSSTLKQRVTTPEQRELVQRIEDAVTALQSMFDGLLHISRLDSGMLEPNLEACDLAAMLLRVGQEFQPQATQKGLHLRIHVSQAWVNSDSMLLGRMLNNLVANAIRYTEQGGLLLACRRRKGQWVVQIWDTGVGMADEHLTKIFDEYYQVGNAERNSAQGMGLGLAIVAGIARILDCKIEVFSRLGRGSVFNIILPQAQTPPINRRSSAGRQFGQFNLERVLIIEDDQAARESLQGLLTSWGLDVRSAGSYLQASDCLDQDAVIPALIICDYRLPQTSGVETVAALRARVGVEVRAILISGDTAPESVELMQASGLPILYKPVRPAKLRALITSYLDTLDSV